MKLPSLMRFSVCFSLVAALIACNNLGEDSHSAGEITASKNAVFSFADSADDTAPSSNIFEIEEDTLSIVLSGDIIGRELFLVKTNQSDISIDSSKVRYVASVNDEPTPVETKRTIRSTRRFFDDDIITHFAPSQDFDPQEIVARDARTAVAATGPSTGGVQSFAIGDMRELFVDTNDAISTFEKRTATLLAIGKTCYVWVVDVQSNRAAELYASEVCEKFEKLYSMITAVYGEESDQIYAFNGKNFSLADMSDYSCTGSKINIVLSRFVSTGTVGYFYCKDYYTGYSANPSDARACSNNGKYVYLNTRYLTTPRNRDLLYSTLAHEFQHLIMFGQKNINRGLSAENWFNEMLSMMCEDLVQKDLGIDDAQSPKNRLGRFAASYYLSGAAEFISVDGSHLPSYSALYGFGAYLLRTYGGASFVNKIMQSPYCNEQAITQAVNEVTGKQMTFSDIVRIYALSFVADGVMSLNQKPEESPFFEAFTDTNTDYDYPLEPIDMSLYMQKGSNGEYGMKLFPPEEKKPLRPNGFTLHTLGKATASEMTIRLNDTSAVGQKLFLVVGK